MADDPAALARIGECDGQKMLQLLRSCSGAFRPGILTALVGSSGAGKTTLMDCLAGRKTSARRLERRVSIVQQHAGRLDECRTVTALHSTVHGMDVLDAGAMMPAAGTITGDVRVSGHPKVQETFARIMGYVEQYDIHSPNVRPPFRHARPQLAGKLRWQA